MDSGTTTGGAPAGTKRVLEVPIELYESALSAMREAGLDVQTFLRHGQDRLRVIQIPAFLRRQAE